MLNSDRIKALPLRFKRICEHRIGIIRLLKKTIHVSRKKHITSRRVTSKKHQKFNVHMGVSIIFTIHFGVSLFLERPISFNEWRSHQKDIPTSPSQHRHPCWIQPSCQRIVIAPALGTFPDKEPLTSNDFNHV